MTPAQMSVLKRLAAGWTLDRYGKDGMQGYMTGRKDEQVVVSAKTVSFLFSYGLISTCAGRWTDFEITKSGRELLERE